MKSPLCLLGIHRYQLEHLWAPLGNWKCVHCGKKKAALAKARGELP